MHWKEIWKQNYTNLDSILSAINIKEYPPLDRNSTFRINVPRRIVQKISGPSCPLFGQFIPLREEQTENTSFSCDPLDEQSFRPTPNILYKYAKRALLLCSNACAMHCRFCFRRCFSYIRNPDLTQDLSWLASNNQVSEVILSGGDPLALSTPKLHSLLTAIEHMPHIQRIRFHTRFPIGIPERIDHELLSCLSSLTKPVVFVIHVNHALELDNDVCQALQSIHKLGIPLLSQTVLLKGVNDSYAALADLFTSLANTGIIPYYLHQLDRIQGASHFEVAVQVGQQLICQLQESLSGFMVPKYVQERPGALCKTDASFMLSIHKPCGF